MQQGQVATGVIGEEASDTEDDSEEENPQSSHCRIIQMHPMRVWNNYQSDDSVSGSDSEEDSEEGGGSEEGSEDSYEPERLARMSARKSRPSEDVILALKQREALARSAAASSAALATSAAVPRQLALMGARKSAGPTQGMPTRPANQEVNLPKLARSAVALPRGQLASMCARKPRSWAIPPPRSAVASSAALASSAAVPRQLASSAAVPRQFALMGARKPAGPTQGMPPRPRGQPTRR
jgi:hypothetical protein